MQFEGFARLDFASREESGFVYVFFWVHEDGKEVPFYVGETQSVWRRLDDYYWAAFYAATDFNVGEAVKHFRAIGRGVIAKYKSSDDRKREQDKMIGGLRKEGHTLLNGQLGYNYKKTTEADQRLRVQAFVDSLLAAPTTTH